jgi:hypothetical protein
MSDAPEVGGVAHVLLLSEVEPHRRKIQSSSECSRRPISG